MCITDPDDVVALHLMAVTCFLVWFPVMCALVVSVWPKSRPNKNYRGDKHW